VTHFAFFQRMKAIAAQTSSTMPKGHAPCKNPYTEPKMQAAEKARIKARCRRSSA